MRLAYWFECSPMAWETAVQSQVESYNAQKLFLIPPFLSLSIIKERLMVSGEIQGKK